MIRLLTALLLLTGAASADPLPSWNDTASRSAIIAFVRAVTTADTPTFVPEAERVAVFDNDGTLWSERPVYFQLLFAIDRVKAMAPDNPEWAEREPFKSALAGDMAALAAQGEHGLLELVMGTHAGMTVDEFAAVALDWVSTAQHPRFDRPYRELVYQPMLELLDYLRDNGFRTYIVSGGGIEFMRPWTEPVYGIPPEQVVGSSIKTRFELRDDEPVLVRLPEINFIDDKAGKPVGINQHIGRRPIFAFGNSDGDLQMLQWTMGGQGARFAGIVRHTDAEREWAYDRDSHVGRLDQALDEAEEKGWVVVDMQADWKQIYPYPVR
ncbi:MAG: HAD family hydrolase [Pseudomonadota bacterium]